ncbi:MAG TPA: flagellar biosynthesis protein FlhF, partial [Thermoguttaceae bacterium]
MSDALALVRRELGPDATVLHTREVSIGRLFGLLSGQRQIEVTASRDVNIPSRLLQKEHSQDAPFESFSLQTYSRPQPATPSMFLQSARQQQELLPDVNEKLADLQTMVKELCRRSKGSKAGDLSEVFFGLFTKLIHADVNEELAQELVERLRREGRAGQSDPLALQARMARMIEADMRAAGPITVTPGQCRVAALVGPTGVGKTTTIAKLAANFRLKEKRRVGLITVDSYRIAAVEQLRMYANIIDLPVKVVSTPNEMREAVSQMSDLDL